MQSKKLEHYKFFEPIAWITCISFAVFVGMLALEFKTTIQDLKTSSQQTEQRIQNLENAINNNSHQAPI